MSPRSSPSLFAVALVGAALVAACAGPAPPRPLAPPVVVAEPVVVTTPPERLVLPRPASLRAPPPEPPAPRLEERLANGLRVVIVERADRPTVLVRLVLPEGYATELATGASSTYFAVSLLGDRYEEDADGHPKSWAEESLRRQVWGAGAQLGFAVEADRSWLGMDGYATDVAWYLEVLAHAVRQPRSGPGTFAARREGLYGGLEDLEVGDPSSLLTFLGRAAFGASHPYAQSPFGTMAGVDAMTLDRVVARQEVLLDPERSTLVIVGDVDARRVASEARRWFSEWQRRGADRVLAPIPPPRIPNQSRVQVIPRHPATTTAICAVRPLSDVKGADAALDVLAAHLGGGPTSRLGRALRTEHGLSYTDYAVIERRRQARALVVCTRVLATSSKVALQLLLRVLEDVAAAEPTPEELERAKGAVIADLEARRDSMAGLLANELDVLELGPGAASSARIAALSRVTAGDVGKLARRVLARKTLQVLVAGEELPAKQALDGLGLGRPEVVRAAW